MPVIEESLDVARRQIQHMSRLLEDLLDVSRITRGKVELRKKPVDFNSIVNHAVEAACPLHRIVPTRARRSALPPEPLWVEGDPTRLEQIVSNLLNNAAKYTEPGGRITITLAPGSGPGRVDRPGHRHRHHTRVAEHTSSIFSCKTTVAGSCTRGARDRADARPKSRRVARRHGLGFESWPGRGSEFTVRFPAILEGRPRSDVERGRLQTGRLAQFGF